MFNTLTILRDHIIQAFVYTLDRILVQHKEDGRPCTQLSEAMIHLHESEYHRIASLHKSDGSEDYEA
jgi:hypothetical protein